MESQTSLVVSEGDITTLAVDAIVNAANSHLWMGGGVAGAIKRAGGETIEREAVAAGPIAVGDAIATGAGRLAAKYVIHAAVMGQDLRTDTDRVLRATGAALQVAKRLGVQTVAFPALGTGVGGLPMDVCARAMVSAVLEHLAEETSVRQVVFAVLGEEARQAFAHELREEQS